MEIMWWQILLLTIYAGYQILDDLQFNIFGHPVFAGIVSGLIMGTLQLDLSLVVGCS